MTNNYIPDSKINLIIDFYNNKHSFDARSKEIYKNVRIGSLINTIRNIYNKGKKQEDGSYKYRTDILTKKQIDTLNLYDFKWNKHELNGTIIDDSWEYNYLLLNEFVKTNNRLPKSYELYNEKDIGHWLVTQKYIINNGEKQEDGSVIHNKYTLTKEKVKKLKKLDIYRLTSSNEINNKRWLERFKLLKKYLKENNNEYPKQDTPYEGFYLGSWISRQRQIFNNGTILENGDILLNRSVLTKEQIDKLNSIKFVWISNKNRYLNKIINDKEELEMKKRYLLEELNRIYKNKNNEFKVKNDIEKINKNLIKILNK